MGWKSAGPVLNVMPGSATERFVEEADRGQWTLLPECLDDFIDESNPVRVIDVFVDALDLAEMSFEGVEPAGTGRPSYHLSLSETQSCWQLISNRAMLLPYARGL
jgi:hypothetical protein